jgi:hypothetical protein
MLKPSELPDDLPNRTSRIQHFIAGNLIKPTSRLTGEQRILLQPHGEADSYGRTHITPDTFANSITDVNRSVERIPEHRENLEKYTFARDMLLEQMRTDIPQHQKDMATAQVKRMYQPQIDRAQRSLDHAEKAEMPLTGLHTTLAALLGKRAVGWSLSDANSKNSDYLDMDTTKEPAYPFEDSIPGMTVSKNSEIAEGKAAHHADTASLPLLQRVASRVAPWHANVHALNSAYGGPEEGGWTYTTGKTITNSRGYITQRGARRAAERLSEQFKPGRHGVENMSASDVYQMDRDQGAFEPLEYTDNMADSMGMPSKFIQEPNDEDYDYSHFGKPSTDYDVTVTRGKAGDYPKNKPYYQ